MRHYKDCDCDEGKLFNNGDPTCGQYVECKECDYEEVYQRECREILLRTQPVQVKVPVSYPEESPFNQPRVRV